MLCTLSLFLEILRILCVAEVAVPPIPSGKVYAWKEKSKYYYLNLRQKLVEILTPSPYSLVEIVEGKYLFLLPTPSGYRSILFNNTSFI